MGEGTLNFWREGERTLYFQDWREKARVDEGEGEVEGLRERWCWWQIEMTPAGNVIEKDVKIY